MISYLKKNKLAYFLITPAILAMLTVHFVPMLQGIYMSFLKLNQHTLLKFLEAPFIGLKNYSKVLFDPTSSIRLGFFEALRNTGIYSITVNIAVLVIAMILAMIINQEFKGRGIARTLLLLPWVVPTYVVGVLWGFMWQQDNGIINKLLVDVFHILGTKPFWLMGSKTLTAIIIPTIWRSFPMTMIMLLAGLQAISSDYYEAAEIDGASGWQKFRYITLPFIKPILATLVLFGMIGTIYSYNLVVMMFGNGGGYPGEWGDLLMTNIQRNSFELWQMGLGSAASVVLMVLVLVLTGIWYRTFRDSLSMD